jgi:hypothetical protein
MKKVLISILSCIALSSCINYDVDYQKSILKEIPSCTIYNTGNSDEYIVVTKDSSVYMVICGATDSRVTSKKFIFSFHK